jgi:hypothetical protein
MMQDLGDRAHARDEASLVVEAAQKLLLVRPRRAIHGTGGKDCCLFGIEPVSSDHNGQLPWNLPGREL